MIEMVTDKHYDAIVSLFEEAQNEIKIISPFLSEKTAELLCNAAKRDSLLIYNKTISPRFLRWF